MEPTPIAIIGMAARLPMAADTDQYWANLTSERDCISRLTEEDLLAAGVQASEFANPSYVPAAPLLPDAGGFDPGFFGMTPRAAVVTDPQQRLFLETSYLAAENAGYDPRNLPESVGVFAGAAHGDYAEHYVKADRKLRDSSGEIEIIIGTHNDYIASSVAYRLGLSGPAVTLGTACSSSLVAIHLACVSLRTGESDLALAGGVCVEMPYGHGYRWLPGSTVSRDGVIRPFDAHANGTVFGSGVGVVALRRLDDALAAGDPIRAVILGSAINNDGAAKVTFSAPSVDGQSAVIAKAMRQAGLTPGQIGYVEAHGTGTSVGDPLELSALELAYRQLANGELPAGTIPLGSAKGNIGHTGQAAGVAGLIKTVLCLEHEQIVPTLNFTTLNPLIAADATPFRIVASPEPWPRGETPRFTAVSSFGIGGTNAHVVLSEAPGAAMPTATTHGPQPVLWSAHNAMALAEYASRLSAHLAARPATDLKAVTTTLLRSRVQHRLRAGAVADDTAEAAGLLAAGDYLTASGEDVQSRATVFMLPGQGSQYPGMGTGLYGADEAFAAAADEAHAAFRDAGCDLRDRWLSGAEEGNDTRIVQALMFVTDYAVARCLIAHGVQPTALVGHSLGELVAACLAGVMSVRDAARAVVARAAAMADLPPGRLIAVVATPNQLEPLLGSTIQVAAINGPGQIVVGTRLEGLEEAARALKAAGLDFRVLDTSHAFHTPLMKPAADAVIAALSDVVLAPPEIRLASATTGRWLTDQEALDPAFWAANIAQPVYFGDAIAEALSEPTLLIEAGPGAALTAAAALQPDVRLGDSVAIATLRRAKPGTGQDEMRSLLTAVTRAWVEGADVRWSWRQGAVRCVPLPPYPFQRSPYWAGTVETGTGTARRPAAQGERLVAVQETATTPFTKLGWRESDPGPIRPLTGEETALALMPSDACASSRISRWLRQCGYRVIAVTEGPHFTEDDGAFTVNLSQAGDQLRRVMSALPEQRWPSVVVHGVGMETGWAVPDPAVVEDQLDRGIRSLVAVTQCCLQVPPHRQRPRLVAVTTHAVDVSGDERLDPLKAAMTGVIRSARLEEPGLAARLIDVSDRTADGAVTRELLQASVAPVVALRSDQRWQHDERQVVLDGPADQPIRRSGVYLVTGGLGAVGATVAHVLVETGQEPTVVLVGRSPAPAADGSGGPASRRFRMLKETGGDIHYLSADMTNSRDVRRCLDLIAAQFGPINGVFHAAGTLPSGPLSTLRPENLDRVLAPKVTGSLLLEQQLANSPALDLFVHFSSRAAINGLVDGADYAAANAFADAHARTSRLARGRFLSVNWPAWGRAGMAIEGQRSSAAESNEAGRELCLRTIELSPGSWVVDEHQLEGTPLFPGTGYVDLILTALADEVPVIATTTVEDLVFSAPLAITAPRSVWLAARTGNGARQVRVMSRPADSDGPWVTHATARLRDVNAAEPASMDVSGLIRRLGPRKPDAVIADAGLLTFGPRWQCLTDVHGSADANEWLCELRLPGQFVGDLRGHFAHPAVLDMAGAVITTGAEGRYLPYAYERVRAFRRVPAHVFAHVRRDSATRESIRATIDLVDADGRRVLEISGLILRRVEDPAALKADLATGTGDTSPTPAINGLPPETAGRLLLHLLGHTRRHVMGVIPFVNGAADPTGIGMPPRTESAPAPDGARELARARGPAPNLPGADTPAAAVAPSDVTAVAESLLRILSEVLGLETGSVDDDFFELGGNSLSAVTFMSAVENQLGLALGIGSLFDHPTPRLMAEAIRDGRHG